MIAPTVLGDGLLELRDVLTENELLALAQRLQCGQDFARQTAILRLEIKQRHDHVSRLAAGGGNFRHGRRDPAGNGYANRDSIQFQCSNCTTCSAMASDAVSPGDS